MTVKIGEYEFDHVSYDSTGDVLYLSAGVPEPAASTYGSPEGHAVRFDEAGQVIGMTIVNAKWLIERDGKISITVPKLIETPAEDLAPALRV
jgi:uncharacterized protein YuzE